LRPDGHVGLCGPRLEAEAVVRYASQHLHLVGRPHPAPLAKLGVLRAA